MTKTIRFRKYGYNVILKIDGYSNFYRMYIDGMQQEYLSDFGFTTWFDFDGYSDPKKHAIRWIEKYI